jgi:hypothetical protein
MNAVFYQRTQHGMKGTEFSTVLLYVRIAAAATRNRAAVVGCTMTQPEKRHKIHINTFPDFPDFLGFMIFAKKIFARFNLEQYFFFRSIANKK